MARIVNGIEELETLLGQEVAVSDWFLVDQSRIQAFAEVTQDTQWIHLDPDRAAKESPYGTTIAHGFLTLSMLSDLSRQAIDLRGDFRMRINYGLNRVRFPAAVPSGSRIRGRFALAGLENLAGCWQITWDCTIEVEGQSKPAAVAQWLIRVYR
jgi:acyl dehydratase